MDSDYAIRYDDGGKVGWVHDRHTDLPAMFSKESAEGLCINKKYTVRKVRLEAYDITDEETK
jgi:hypothetical protein